MLHDNCLVQVRVGLNLDRLMFWANDRLIWFGPGGVLILVQ